MASNVATYYVLATTGLNLNGISLAILDRTYIYVN